MSEKPNKRNSRRDASNEAPTPKETVEKVVFINRCAKVVKGGRILSFAALTVVGDNEGGVGMGKGKSREVPVAVTKAMEEARRKMVKVSLKNGTFHHAVIGKHGSSVVIIQPASEGTGVIASGPVRSICDGAGIKNILTKVHRSSNPMNVVKATFDGLLSMKKRVDPVAEVAPKA
jgi:small subunit ribosomal protein S5